MRVAYERSFLSIQCAADCPVEAGVHLIVDDYLPRNEWFREASSSGSLRHANSKREIKAEELSEACLSMSSDTDY